VNTPLSGPPSAKEAKESKDHQHVKKRDPHPPTHKLKTRGHGHDHGPGGAGGAPGGAPGVAGGAPGGAGGAPGGAGGAPGGANGAPGGAGGHGHGHGHGDSSDTDSMDTDSMDTDSLGYEGSMDTDSLDEHDSHPPDGKKKKKIPRGSKGHADKGHGNGDGMEGTSTHKQSKKTKSAPLVRKQAESKNDDFIEKSHSGKSSKRSNMDTPLSGPPSAKEAKESKHHKDVEERDPHPPISKRKLPDKHAQTKKKASRKPNLPTIPENRQNVAIWRRNRGLEHLSVKRKHLRIKRGRF